MEKKYEVVRKLEDKMAEYISVVEHWADVPMALGSAPSTENKITYFCLVMIQSQCLGAVVKRIINYKSASATWRVWDQPGIPGTLYQELSRIELNNGS